MNISLLFFLRIPVPLKPTLAYMNYKIHMYTDCVYHYANYLKTADSPMPGKSLKIT